MDFINKSSNYITEIIQNTKEEGKKTLYLILQKKPIPVEIIEELNEKLEKRLEQYIKRIIPELVKMKPENPEKTLKYISLKASYKILEEIIKEQYLKLNEKDKISAKVIYENYLIKEQNKENNDINDNDDNKDNLYENHNNNWLEYLGTSAYYSNYNKPISNLKLVINSKLKFK